MRVCVVLTARPSYAKWRSILFALKDRCELQIVVGCSALLERYGNVSGVLRADGFEPDAECWTVLEGENLLTGAREVGIAMMDFAAAYARLKPDVVCVMADRREILAAASAARMQNIAVAHCQGGERSGSVDDRIRDAVTQLSDLHFVCTERARFRVYGLTGEIEHVYFTGCSSIDLAKQALSEPLVTDSELGGSGPAIDVNQPFVVVLQHADTRYADHAYDEMVETLEGVKATGYQAIVLWPGQDAGAAGISKAIRERAGAYRTLRNLPPNRYLRLLSQSACLTGNSSSGIRESAYLGTPVCNVGLRQWGRERAKNVLDGPHERLWIAEAIKAQVAHGKYAMSGLYGNGNSGEQIAEVLCGSSGARPESAVIGWSRGARRPLR